MSLSSGHVGNCALFLPASSFFPLRFRDYVASLGRILRVRIAQEAQIVDIDDVARRNLLIISISRDHSWLSKMKEIRYAAIHGKPFTYFDINADERYMLQHH